MKKYKVILRAGMVFAMLGVTACASNLSDDIPRNLPNDLKDLKLVEKQLPNLLYMRDESNSIAKYSSFYIPDVKVLSQFNAQSNVSESDTLRLLSYFKSKLKNELARAGLEVTEKPSANTLSINLSITGLNRPINMTSSTVEQFQNTFKKGAVTVVAAFSNANTARVEALALHVMKDVKAGEEINDTNYSSIAGAFDVWSANVAKAISASQ